MTPVLSELSPRHEEVLDLMTQGLTNREIAGRLGLSVSTARDYVSEVLRRTGTSTRLEAALLYQRSRLVPHG